jgi:hypothetical protein
MAEQVADSKATIGELLAVCPRAFEVKSEVKRAFGSNFEAGTAVVFTAEAGTTVVGTTDTILKAAGWSAAASQDAPAEWQAQCDLLRDMFGNPFRSIAVDATWGTSTVLAIAREMYESRDFSAMPILADALQEADCDNDDILNHCRAPNPHARGCWVVDALLGKT